MAYNKKILSDILKNLNKTKAPVKPKDIDYNSKMGYRDDSPFRNKSSIDINTPNGTIDMSNTGKPLLANGRYLPPYSGTHQFNTNVVTEQPLQAKKGGLVRMPKPSKKGLASKKYSRSLFATNKLFTENALLKKERSKKNKVFDPNAKYYQDGGINKLEGDLISKVLMERNRGTDFVDRAYALGDNPGTPMFNLPDDEQFGQNMSHKMAWGEDDAGQAYMFPTVMNPNDEAIQVPNQYADYISSEGYKNATGMNYQDGGFVIDLSKKEIEEYRKGGYIVEEVTDSSIPALNTYAKGGGNCDPGYYYDGKECLKIPEGADPSVKKSVIYVDDKNDPRYKDYLIKQALYNYSNNPNFNQKNRAYYDLMDLMDTIKHNPDNPENWDNKFSNDYYHSLLSEEDKNYQEYPEDYNNEDSKVTYAGLRDPNVGFYGSKVEYSKLPSDKLKTDEYYDDRYFDFSNLVDDPFFQKYQPSGWERKLYYSSYPFINSYATNGNLKRGNKDYWTTPNTVFVEDEMNRDELRKIYPNISDSFIDKHIADARKEPVYISNKFQNGAYDWADFYDDDYNYMPDKTKKTFIDRNNLKGYLQESVTDHITRHANYVPTWSEPEEIYQVKRALEEMQPLKLSLINQQLDLGPRGDIIEEDLPPTYTPSGDDYINKGYKHPLLAKRIQRKTNFNPDYYADYLDEEDNYIEGEVTKAEKENRRIDFSGGATTKKDLKAQKKYNKAYDEYEKIIKQKELERKFIESQIGLSAYFKNGGDVSSEFIELELDDNEIEKYKRGGYIVEEIPEMQPGGSFKLGKGYKMPTLSKDEIATIKKEVAKAKPVAAKKPVAKKPSTSSFADRAAQVEKENKLKGIENKAVDDATYIADRNSYNKERVVDNLALKKFEDDAVAAAILERYNKPNQPYFGLIGDAAKLDPEREKFIRDRAKLEYYNSINPTVINPEFGTQIKQEGNLVIKENPKISANRLLYAYPELMEQMNQVERTQLFNPNKLDIDAFATPNEKAIFKLNELVRDSNRYGLAVDLYKNDSRGKPSSKNNGKIMSTEEMIREDMIKAIQNNKNPEDVLNKISEATYNEAFKEYDKLPFMDFTGGTDKIGFMWRDFLADPLNVTEELIWDDDYVPNRHMILRNTEHPLHKYYMNRTEMDKSPLSQGLQYINPFSSGAEARVAMDKGNYGDAALQLGEGVLKTVALAGAPELFSAASQVYVPGAAAIGLPGLSLASVAEIAGVGYGVTQLPQTVKAIGKAIETGKKEDIRSAVNQTMINGLDFIGIGDLAKITKTPEKLLMNVLMDSNTFRKEAQSMMKAYEKNPNLYATKFDDIKQNFVKALEDAKVKYADEGYNLTPEEILADPSKAQYVRKTFDKYHAESMAYLKSDEGRAAIDKMLRDNPEYAQTRKLKTNQKSVPEKEYINKLFEKEGTQDFVETAIVNLDKRKTMLNNFLDDAKLERTEIEEIYNPEVWEREYARVDKDIERLQTKLNEVGLRQDEFNYIKNNDYDITSEYLQSIRDQDQELYYQAILTDDYSPFQHPLATTKEEWVDIQNMTTDNIINYYDKIDYRSTNRLMLDAQSMVTHKPQFEKIKQQLAQMDPTHPDYIFVKNEHDFLWREMMGYNNSSLPVNNAYYNPTNNDIAIGHQFMPGKAAGQTVAHEIGHAEPWEVWSDRPGGKIIRADGLEVPYSSPTDKILADITLYDDVPDFIKQEFYKTKLKPKKYVPQNVDELSTGKDPFSYNTLAEVRENWDRNGKNYFLYGSNGNEKTTFMVELKHAMMDEGYGTRGAFTDQQLQKFWKDYISKARTGKADRHRQRILDIAIPDDKTRKAIVEALNMPNAFEEGGSVNNYNLGDEVDEATMKELEKQGYIFQKIK